MAVQEQTPYIEYTANGTATSFALGFDCDNQDHLIVLVDDVEPVVGAWSFSNGNVVFNTAPENGKKINIQRNTPFSRTTDYQSYNNSFRPPAVNNDFDRAWYKIQELGVKDWLLDLKIQKFRDDVNLTALENTLEEARQIRDDTADSVVEVQSNVTQSQTLLENTTVQANLAQGYANSASSANAAAQQAVIDVSTAEADVYSALSAQQIAVNNSLTAIAGGHKAYQTLAAAQAAQASFPANSIIEVTNDGANNGTYQWNGTTLTKSAYDPLTLAKADATTKANAAEANAIEYTDEKTFGVAKIVDLTSLEKTTQTDVFPIVVDRDNKILLGYDESEDKIFGVGLESENSLAADEFQSLSKTTQESILPLVVDNNNKILMGYLEYEGKMFGVGLADANSPALVPDKNNIDFDNTDVSQVVVYGQSLGIGQNAAPISLSQPFYNQTFSGGARTNSGTLANLVETTTESPCSGIANTASYFSLKKNSKNPDQNPIFISTAAIGGTRIDFLKKGRPEYATMLSHVTNAKSLYDSDNKTHSVKAFVWIQGEQEPASGIQTQSGYVATLRQLSSDVDADIKLITGQTAKVVTFIHQIAIHAKTLDGYMQKAQLEAGTNNDDIYLVASTYMFPHSNDKVHLSSVGSKLMGAYFGRAYQQLVHEGIRPKQLIPLAASISEKLITVDFSVPYPPLVFDTLNLPDTQDSGFAVKIDGELVAIKSVSTYGTSVTIELFELPTSSDIKVRYALDHLSPKANILASGATGNLRDSCDDSVIIEGVAKQMFYPCPNFELNVFNGEI